ncbi:hypothetical protein GCM10027266_22140 [Arenimonas alkanexedens]
MLLVVALCLPLVYAVALRGFMLAEMRTAGADRALVWIEGTPAQLDALAAQVDARHGRVPAGRVREAGPTLHAPEPCGPLAREYSIGALNHDQNHPARKLLEELAAETGAKVCRSYMFVFNELDVPVERSMGQMAASIGMQSLLLPAGFVIAGYWAFARQLSLPSPAAGTVSRPKAVAAGLAVAVALWIGLKLLGAWIPDAGIDSGYTIAAIGLPIAVSLVLFEPLMQELALRLWLVTLAERAIGTWPAAVLSGLTVFPMHYSLGWETTLPSAAVGFALAALYIRTRSLWASLTANSALGLALFLP